MMHGVIAAQVLDAENASEGEVRPAAGSARTVACGAAVGMILAEIESG